MELKLILSNGKLILWNSILILYFNVPDKKHAFIRNREGKMEWFFFLNVSQKFVFI